MDADKQGSPAAVENAVEMLVAAAMVARHGEGVTPEHLSRVCKRVKDILTGKRPGLPNPIPGLFDPVGTAHPQE